MAPHNPYKAHHQTLSRFRGVMNENLHSLLPSNLVGTSENLQSFRVGVLHSREGYVDHEKASIAGELVGFSFAQDSRVWGIGGSLTFEKIDLTDSMAITPVPDLAGQTFGSFSYA